MKNSQNIAFTTLILIILGVLILTILVFLFTSSFSKTTKALRLTEYEFCQEIYKQSLAKPSSTREIILNYFFETDASTGVKFEVKTIGGTTDPILSDKINSMKGKCKKYILIFPDVEEIIKKSKTTLPGTGTYDLVYAKIFLEI
ncbi:MAG: hypothetical protein QXR30_04500 [Candidatus Woesearchaeota archaeon]